jgi:hypothetical protein
MIAYCRCFFGLVIATLLGAPAWSQPVAGEPWGARSPAQCTPLKQSKPPTVAQASQLFRCAKESGSLANGELWLVENLKIDVGGPMPYAAMYPILVMQAADTSRQVYPIRGSWTWSTCMLRKDAGLRGDPNLNCREAEVTGASGGCWQTTFGDWKCNMAGGSTGPRSALMRPRQ